jgi:Protein of unknown function (DUF3592)
MKILNCGRSFLIFVGLAGLLSAQNTVPPAAAADGGPPWGVLALLVVVGLGAGGWLIIKATLDGRKSKASALWPSVQGTVVFSQMVDYRTGGGTTSIPKVTYSYAVNEQAYECSTVKFGIARSEKLVAKYPRGNAVEVFFDPQKPSDAVLEKGGSTTAILLGGVGIIVFCLGVSLWMMMV